MMNVLKETLSAASPEPRSEFYGNRLETSNLRARALTIAFRSFSYWLQD